jgi:hypothetical protein
MSSQEQHKEKKVAGIKKAEAKKVRRRVVRIVRTYRNAKEYQTKKSK